MSTMYRRKKDKAGRWPKLLLQLSRLVNRMRSQASAYIAIAQTQRSVERKIKAAGPGVCGKTKGKNE
jgi:hypothetical protein